MNLTKKGIAKLISNELKVSNKDSNLLTNKFINILQKKISMGKILKISGFGTFNTQITPKRIGRNPKSKESYIINRRNRVRFTMSKRIRSLLN
tara:strand:+ start:249 stop:527 length:279 start_codon:yes stop_codon:yes gene_type:complete